MAGCISIPFWPNSLDCIDWSKDNHIVVVGGENIAILTPRLHEKGPNGRLWDTASIKVNAFSVEEVPVEDILANSAFSIGEELSLRQAISAKWSPPGLAQHKGCALAVLTANHVLSIWAPDGRTTVSSNWKRRLVINHSIKAFYEGQNKRVGQKHDRNKPPQAQQRVLSFSWTPPVIDTTPNGLGGGYPFLCVATEGGHLFFLRIQCPYYHYQWAATIHSVHPLSSYVELAGRSRDLRLGESDPSTAQASGSSSELSYGECVRKSMEDVKATTGILVAEQVTYGPWRRFQLDDQWDPICGVAFTTDNSGRTCAHIATEISSLSQPAPTLDLPECTPSASQGRWRMALEESKALFAAENSLYTAANVQEHMWGMISSPLGEYVATCSSMHPANAIAYIIGSEQISAFNITYELDLSEGRWLPQVVKAESIPMETLVFSLKQNFERKSSSVAVMSSSEVDSIVQEVLDHIPAHEYLGSQLDTCSSLPAVLKVLRRLTHKSNDPSAVTFSQSIKTAHDIITQEVLDGETLCGTSRPSKAVSSFPPLQDPSHARPRKWLIIWALRLTIFSPLGARKERAARIIKIASSGPDRRILIPIVKRLLEAIQQLLSVGATTSDSLIYEQGRDGHRVYDMDAISLLIERNTAIIYTKLNPTSDNTATAESLESCKICSYSIPFEALKWAKCRGGHEFPRCALSFLAVQTPGSTKMCGICGLQFLNEQVVTELQLSSKEDVDMQELPESGDFSATTGKSWTLVSMADAKPTLAQLLFAACDVCLYCGGKFTVG